MTIRTEEAKVPGEFPPARLFLDDIDEIVRVLREVLESRILVHRPTEEVPKTKVTLSIAGKECDDVQDLPKIGKSNRELRIRVSRGDWGTSMNFRPWIGTMWAPFTLITEDAWSVYHKLEPLFQKRTRRWSALLRSLPFWLVWSLWAAPVFLLPFLRFPLYKLMPHRAADAIVLLSYAVIITAALIGVRHTTIAFRHSWDPSPFRQYLKDKLVPVIAGALLGIGATILEEYLRHKFWP